MNMRKKILVYGIGKFYNEYYQELVKNYTVVARFDKSKTADCYGKAVLRPEEIRNYPELDIVIMVDDIPTCLGIARYLKNDCDVFFDRIKFGSGVISEWGNKTGVRILKYFEDDFFSVEVKGFSFKTESADEIMNVKEVLVDEIYKYYLNNSKQDVIIDVGMNIGDCIYYFINRVSSLKSIYGYEPFRETFFKAKDNTKMLQNKGVQIYLNQVGWSNRDESIDISFNPQMSCGMSIIKDNNNSVYSKYDGWGLLNESEMVEETIITQKASNILSKIIDENGDCNFVLKMDCEGSEYDIVKDLHDLKLLQKLSIIMLEWHYKGCEPIIDILNEAGFSYFSMNKTSDMGLIYAFKTI